MFAKCDADDYRTCSLLFTDPQAFAAKSKSGFFNYLTYLLNAAEQGTSWAHFFSDGKKFHSVHHFSITRVVAGKNVKENVEVFQFKKGSAHIRILFVQSNMGQLNMFVTHVFEKSVSKTPINEKSRAENLIKEFFAAVDSNSVSLVTDQGGSAKTPRFK